MYLQQLNVLYLRNVHHSYNDTRIMIFYVKFIFITLLMNYIIICCIHGLKKQILLVTVE